MKIIILILKTYKINPNNNNNNLSAKVKIGVRQGLGIFMIKPIQKIIYSLWVLPQQKLTKKITLTLIIIIILCIIIKI